MNPPVMLSGDALGDFTSRLAHAAPLLADLVAESVVEAHAVDAPTVLGAVGLFEVVVLARRRPIEMMVADLGADLLVLGDPQRVDDLAGRVGLHLRTRDEVAEYLRFWFRAATRHAEALVESPADFQWIPGVTSDPDLRAHADRSAHLARHVTVGHPAGGSFPAEVTMLDQRTLYLCTLRVDSDGHVEEVSRVMLMEDVPVPYVIP